MRFLLVLLLVISGLTIAQAAPIPRDMKAPPKPLIAGSTWYDLDLAHHRNGVAKMKFHEDGRVEYWTNQSAGDGGKWKIVDGKLQFDINNYSFWVGVIERDSIKVTVRNSGGLNWISELKPYTGPGPEKGPTTPPAVPFPPK